MGFFQWLAGQKQAPASNQHLPKREAAIPTKKEPTFRIRGVPNDWDRDKLESFLAERDSLSLPVVQSLAKEFHGRSQTATVLFRNACQLPLRISLPTPYGEFGELRNLTLDHGFLGITSLFAPPQQDHKVDILAISGLGGHAFGSFKERGGEHMWLRDALPYGITNASGKRIARIMVYGYDSSLPNSDSFQNLEDLGTTLHSDLRTLATDGSFKPIIIVAHSLGGLVVKQFLISLSKSKDKVDQRLRRAVYGIAFFGVPHDGMDIRSLIPMAGDGPNRFLLESIGSTNSQILSIQHRDFSQALVGQGQSEIVSFYETRLSPTAVKDELGRWSMSGASAVLVSKASATHCRPWEDGPEHICAINRAHSEMVKFAEGDPEYDKVLGRINSLAQRAIIARRSPLLPDLSQDQRKCLQSLAFEQMQERGNDIEHAVQGTCEWLLSHETYINWATSHEGLLWIKGKPGSGKSTLVKYAFSKQRDMPDARDDDVVLSFFFHGRGNTLQKTPLGCLLSILHQALKQAPQALGHLVDAFQEKCKDNPPGKWQWHPDELWDIFKSSLPNILADRSIWLFVDALDECGDVHARHLVQKFKSLLERLPPLESGIHFRICFSCRHYPILSSPGMFEVCLEMENKSDICTYVRSELKLSSFEEPIPTAIQNLIISRAAGIFLWARLVVKQVQDLELDGAGSNMIEATIRAIPEGLHELYKELINGMEPFSVRLIQWLCFATRPLSVEELRWAIVTNTRYISLEECRKADHYIPDSKRMTQQIIKLGRGLAEVTPGPGTQVVQLIHQSVKDFFMDKGLVNLDDSSISADEAIGMAQFQLLKTCIHYLQMDEIGHSLALGREQLEAEFPFLHYATISWVSHARFSEATRFSQENMLELLAWPSNTIIDLWTRVFTKINSHSSHCPSTETTLVHIAARYGLVRALTAILQHNGQASINVDVKDEGGRTSLTWAAECGHEAAVRLLIDNGAEIDAKDRTYQTSLSFSAKNGHGAIVKLLLGRGAEVDTKDQNGKTPLFWAARNGHEAIAKMLLKAGADVDLEDHHWRTPLSWAAANGHDTIVNLLLDSGARIDSEDDISRTPISWATRAGESVAAKLLLERGAKIDTKDRGGQTPLLWAARLGTDVLIKDLVDKGAQIESKDQNGRTVLFWAARMGRDIVVKQLIDLGAEIDSKDDTGWTPLLAAAGRGREAVVKLLLVLGADVDSKDNHGQTALSLAIRDGHEAIVRLLEESSSMSP
ncbi:ankyrin repeat-containing domain protein [Trichoderma chlorosporum]